MCLRTANRPWGLGSDLQQEAEDKLFAICRLKDETKPDPWPHPASPRLTWARAYSLTYLSAQIIINPAGYP